MEAEMNGIHINLMMELSETNLEPEYRYASHAGYKSRAINASLDIPSMRWSRAVGLATIQRKSAATTRKYREITDTINNKPSTAPNPSECSKGFSAASLRGLFQTIAYKTPDISPLTKAHAANNIGPIKHAMTSATRLAFELVVNPSLPTLNLGDSTLHIRLVRSTDSHSFRETGAVSQERNQ
jgi:hypothetical protein